MWVTPRQHIVAVDKKNKVGLLKVAVLQIAQAVFSIGYYIFL